MRKVSRIDDQRRAIELWCATPSQIDESLMSEYRKLLSETERAQEMRMYFNRDRCRYLVTRALVRIVLSKYAPVAPEDWVFALSQYGKPSISRPHSFAADISFNITHGGNLIIIAVTRGIDIGVDTESISSRLAPLGVLKSSFSSSEISSILSLSEDEKNQRFYEHWTLKEAYVKARGLGTYIPLEAVDFDLKKEGLIELKVDPIWSDQSSRWYLWQLWPDDEHVVAVCAENLGTDPPKLSMTSIVPFLKEVPCSYRLTRVSALPKF